MPKISYKVKFADEIWAREVAITWLWFGHFGHCWLNAETHLIKVHLDGLCVTSVILGRVFSII